VPAYYGVAQSVSAFSMKTLSATAPPMWALLAVNAAGEVVPSEYAMDIRKDSDMYKALDVLASKVGILGIFSDRPATVTYYANCMGLK
jgi:glycerophosphoryl diester phosphodiesterase